MNAATLYQETSITTQDKGKVVVMLYDGAIRFLKKAKQAIQEGDLTNKNVYLAKTRDIIYELNQSLNMEVGGTLASNLRSLYNFLWRYIGQINIKNDTEMLDKAVHILEDLGGAWKKISN